jgi:hypothetical protein
MLVVNAKNEVLYTPVLIATYCAGRLWPHIKETRPRGTDCARKCPVRQLDRLQSTS